MKGFVYLDADGQLVRKDYEYITTEHPTFWSDNAELIVKWWRFDTDVPSSIREILLQLKALNVEPARVAAFREAIGLPVPSKSNNASKVQSG